MFAKRMLLTSLLITAATASIMLAVVLTRAADTNVPTIAAPRKPAPANTPASDPPIATTAKVTSKSGERSTDFTADLSPSAAKVYPPIFSNWETPKVTIIISGDQEGYIEPCGCSGIENQKGGLSRRFTFLRDLETKGWNPVPLDLGGVITRFGLQNEIKYAFAVDGMKKMGYQAIGFSPSDLRIPADKLLSSVASVQQKNKEAKPSSFVSANVGLLQFDDTIMPRYKILSRNGVKIGVTTAMGADELKNVTSVDVVKTNPTDKDALPAAVAAFKKANCDMTILLAYADQAEVKALAMKYPDFDYIVTADGNAEPPLAPGNIAGSDTKMIEVGQKAMFVVALGVFPGGKKDVKYERVPMDARFADSKEMKSVMSGYQLELEKLGFDKLGIKSLNHPSGNKFVGSKVCKDCHDGAYKIWQATGHAHSLDTLAKQDVPRQFDAECLSCHVTGWDPQKFAPYLSGYQSLAKTPLMAQNGCENCHGPGSQHVDAENAPAGKVAAAAIKAIRKDMHVADQSLAGWQQKAGQMCQQCHDQDNSPKFNFADYWKKIQH